MANSTGESENSVSIDKIYDQTLISIRTTDDISFKLMGIVPLASAIAMLTFFLKEPASAKSAPAVWLSLFAALVTLGLYRWELRNIQTCKWLRERATALEKETGSKAVEKELGAGPNRIGKTEAETFVYALTIFAWLLMPLFVLDFGQYSRDSGLGMFYFLAAAGIAILTLISIYPIVSRLLPENKPEKK